MYGSFSGNLGRDAEIVTTKSGSQMLKFSVADEVYANGKKETQWINCVDFRKSSVEKLVQYLKKGTTVMVSGEVSLNSYEAKDGTTKTSLQCSVTGIRLLGGNKSAEASAPKTSSAVPAFDSDDAPF
ncbi:single-stranded DNA-binding protein [Candidatus Dependentiae bacterium]|nr:MAG: single-stranded DNA-binding protein [Candidatus Dependentiae bacterium]